VAETFGDAYAVYRARVPALIPTWRPKTLVACVRFGAWFERAVCCLFSARV
jgi:hypothetical protein